MKKNILAVIAVLSSANIVAQTVSQEQIHTLNPVVITGTGTHHRANTSPVAVQVITAKQLRDTHATTLQDALSRLTTTVTTHTSGMGTFVNFNGISDDYIVILENGKRVSGDDRWARLNMARVKRIEIFSGAASALYGSDAIAGVINIITDDSREGVSASASTKVMNHGRMDNDVNVDASAGQFSSHTSYSYHTSDSWQVNNYQEFDEDGTSVLKLTGRPMQTGFTSHNLAERLEWQFNQQWSMYLRGSYYDNETARPQSAQYFTQGKKQADGTYPYTPKAAYTYDLHHKSYTYGGGARWSPNRRTFIYLDVYSDNYQSDYDYWQTATKEAYSETRKRTHYVNETLRGVFRLASWNKLTGGTELVQESLDSQSDNIDGEHTATYNLFAQDEVKILPGLEGVAGVRYTYNDNFGSAVTPNAGLFYHIAGFRIRASYAAGYRQPSLSQLYATDQAKTASRYTLYNIGLKPEKNHFWTANVEYGNSWMSVGVTGFINNIRDMINYRTMSDAEIAADPMLTTLSADWKTIRQRDNIDKATLRGFSAQVKLLLPCGFTLGGGYTFTDADAETQSFDKKTQTYSTEKTPVDKSVRHVGNVQATWEHIWRNYHLNIAVNGHLQGERYSSTYGYASGYGMWDFHTTHTIRLRNCTIEPGIGLDNVFNKRDTSYWNSNYSTINPGRSLYASFRMTY